MRLFVDGVVRWARELLMADVSFENLKNCLCSHVFHIDYPTLREYSEKLSQIFLQDLPTFKDMLRKIAFRLVKRIVAQKVERSPVCLDAQQLRIKIEPLRLPVDLGNPQRDGILRIGDHCLLNGQIAQIDPIESIIIRYLYRCKDSECRQLTYRKAVDAIGAIHCRRCGELAREEESGRILINSRHFLVYTGEGFAFRPAEVIAKGKM
jgi:hypothetical protein